MQSAGSRRRKPTSERRREIALAALRIIGREGVASLTTAALASEVGLTTGALFRHFSTLDDILREMVRRALEAMEETFPDPSLPPTERLYRLARNRVRLLRSDRGLAWLLRSEDAFLALPKDAVASLRGLLERSRQYLLEAVRQGMAEGSIRADLEPETLLVPIMGTIHALAGMPGVHRYARGRRPVEPDQVFEALSRMLAPPAGRAPRARKERKK